LEHQLLPGERRRVIIQIEMWDGQESSDDFSVFEMEAEDDGSPRFDQLFKSGFRRGGLDG